MISHGCTHCGGDLFLEHAYGDGPELRCLQCGRTAGSAGAEQTVQERCPKCGLWPRIGTMTLHVAVCQRQPHAAKGTDIVLSERGAAYKAAYLRKTRRTRTR